MRKLLTLLLIAVTVLAGYTYLQVTRLQAEVQELKARGGAVSVTEQRGVSLLVAQARENCRRAQVYLRRGQTRKARQELELCLRRLAKVSELAEDETRFRDLAGSWEDIKRRVDKLWRQFAEEKRPEKGGR